LCPDPGGVDHGASVGVAGGREVRIVLAVLAGELTTAAARQAKVSEQSVSNWKLPVEGLGWCLPAERLARPVVEYGSDGFDLLGRPARELQKA
jgi:hypothetical protein